MKILKKLDLIKKDLANFFEKEFAEKEFYALIYGSHAYGIESSTSDLDLICIVDTYDQRNMDNVINHVIDIHKTFNLNLDNEVPLRNKVLSSYNDISESLKGKGFEITKDNIYIPKIIKSKEFLDSKEISYRLLLNALTSKHIFITGNSEDYSKHRISSLNFITKLILLTNKKERVNISSFVDNLIYNNQGNEGELYLGYKNHSIIKKYLESTFEKHFLFLEKSGIATKTNYDYEFNKNWIKSIIK